MVSVFIGYVIEGLFLSLAAFLLASWGVGWIAGRRAGLSARTRVAGWLLTAVGAASCRLLIALLAGGDVMLELWSNRGIGLVGTALIPLAIALAISVALPARNVSDRR